MRWPLLIIYIIYMYIEVHVEWHGKAYGVNECAHDELIRRA